MNARRNMSLYSLLVLVALLSAACASPTPTAAPAAMQDGQLSRSSLEEPAAIAVTAAPPTQPPVEIASSDKDAGLGEVPASPYRANRLIIKNGEMNLMVADTDRAIDQVTSIAVNSGGYIVGSRTWFDGEFKLAMLTLGVPVDQFEAVQRALRALAVSVLNDTASGQDVSDEYVDLQSRLTNLEATAARIREFLAQAKDVEEALRVNRQLTEVENEIEQIKGRMNYLRDRAAFSTITVNLEPQRPTPTPTATPTPTPTPTPVAWMPEKTFTAASNTLGGILRTLGDLVIWFGVVLGPFAVPAAIVGGLVVRGRRKKM
jgi:hypothetical protein